MAHSSARRPGPGAAALTLVAFGAVSSGALSCGGAELPPEEAVRATVARFLEAVADEDGGDAADEVSWATRDLFHEFRDLAWSASREELRAASPATRIAVLASRYRFSRKLRGMDGRELFAAAVSDGWLTPFFDGDVEVRAVELDGERARIQVARVGAVQTGVLQLLYEERHWRLDLAASMREADAYAQEGIRYTGAPDEEAMQFLLGLHFGEPPDASLWEPLADAE